MRHKTRERAFTLVEVLVVISIFLMVMGLVLGLVITSFRSLREGEKMLDYQQQQRLCLSRLSREISSLVRTSSGETSLVGKEDSFFFDFAREDNVVRTGYTCNPTDSTLERYYQDSQVCLKELSECSFSYSDGQTWKTDWDEDMGQLPRMIKISFKFRDENKERESVVNIPISP